METPAQPRLCRCGTRLARSNRTTLCSVCTKQARTLRQQPPTVPPEFWQTPEMKAALDSCDMGTVLRVFRTHPFHGRDISQDVAAGWVGITQPRLSRLENGEPVNDLGKLMRWAHALGIPTDLLWFRMPGATPTTASTPPPVEGATRELVAAPSQGCALLPVVIGNQRVLVPIDMAAAHASDLGILLDELHLGGYPSGRVVAASSDGDTLSSLSRRSLLTQAVAAAALPALGLDELAHVARALDDARRYLDGSVVDYFRRQLIACKADDGQLGPKQTLPVVLGIVGAIDEHAASVKPAVRRELLSVGADGAEFAGWLYRDLQNQAVAGYWLDRATAWAQEAGDLPMQGYVLLKKSQMAYENRDGLQVLTLAEAAQTGPWQLPNRVRAEVTQQEARGLAMIGEPLSRVEHKLDDARHLFAEADTGDPQHAHLGAYFDDGALALRTASCYIEAGQPQRAATLYGDVLGTGVLSRRDQGYFMARQAGALALGGQPDDAAAIGLQSAEVARAIHSERTRRELRRVLDTLEPWRSRPGPKALREAVSA